MNNLTQPVAPPADFAAQVKQALEHLHDFLYLQGHPLGRDLATSCLTETAGQRLRNLLLDSIEALDPGPDVPFGTPQARLYNLLHLHYVEMMTVQECAQELSVSDRQAYRNLRRAEESVATLIWAKRNQSVQPEGRASHMSSLQQEVDRLAPRPCATDAWALVAQAHKVLVQLAEQRNVDIHLSIPPRPVIIYTDPILAQQVVTGLLSQAVQQSQPGQLSIELEIGNETNSLCVQYRTQEAGQPVQVVQQLADRLGWQVTTEQTTSAETAVAVRMGIHGPTILVIDDNEGLVALLEHYLTDHAYRVVPAANGGLGLQLARDLHPDAIVLDVIMPGIGGWEVLQALRNDVETETIPVILCSVFDDPHLAESLGASICLPKPISRGEMLTALHSLVHHEQSDCESESRSGQS